jgi:hypothetical protein
MLTRDVFASMGIVNRFPRLRADELVAELVTTRRAVFPPVLDALAFVRMTIASHARLLSSRA